jgi:hypothetical protein
MTDETSAPDPWHVGELPGDNGLIVRDQNGLLVCACLSIEAACDIAAEHNGDWNRGYEAGIADGVDDVAPDLIDAARAALNWFEPGPNPKDERRPLADEIIKGLKRALANLPADEESSS